MLPDTRLGSRRSFGSASDGKCGVCWSFSIRLDSMGRNGHISQKFINVPTYLEVQKNIRVIRYNVENAGRNEALSS